MLINKGCGENKNFNRKFFNYSESVSHTQKHYDSWYILTSGLVRSEALDDLALRELVILSGSRPNLTKNKYNFANCHDLEY